MATIVNTRDVELQATSPRVTQVDMQDNIEVSPDQVTGLGLVLEGVKQVILQATSQIFQIPKSGATSPATITLTALVKGLVATPTLTIAPGGGTMSIPVVLTSGAFTFSEAQMTTDTVTFLLTATEGSIDYTDTMTIVKAREGLDSLNGLLTNESHTVPADYLGNVTNYGGASGRFKVFQGINDITTACTFALVTGGNPDGLTYTLTASGASAGNYSVTGSYPTGIDITTLTFRATFGTKTIDKVFTISKAKAGVDGASAKAVRLNPTAQSFTFDGDDNASPATQTITFAAVASNLAGSPSFTATAYNAAGTSLGAITLGGSGSTRTMTNAQFVAPGATVRAVVTVTWDGFTDTITVVKLKDGAGNITGYLTNEATIVATAADGTGGNYSNAGGTFKVFDGLTDQTGTLGPTAYSLVSSSGVVMSISSTTGVYTVTNTTADNGTATLRAVYGGVTIDKVYSISRSKQGVTGTDGIDGIDGERGSRTFYVALAGSGNTWSNSIATTAASVDGGPILNDIVCEYNNSQGYSETRFWNGSSWLVINAVVDGNLIVSGTIGTTALQANSVTAVKIDSRGLSIKDSNGNVIFDADTVIGSDSSSVLGFNPLWSNWTSTLPGNWLAWSGANPTRETSLVLNSPFSVRYTTAASTNQGIYRDADFTTEPLPAGSFIQGTISMRMVTKNAGGGNSGYLIRLYTDAGKTAYVDTKIEIPDATATGVWQRFPFVAGANGLAIYSIRIYQMASWSSFTGSYAAAGNVVLYGPFQFEVREPITSVTSGVWIGNLAVGTLQIADQAVTFPVSAYTAALSTAGSPGTWTTVQSVTITTTGAPVLVIAGLSLLYNAANSGGGSDIRIRRGSTTLSSMTLSSMSKVATAIADDLFGCEDVVTFPAYKDTPSAGTYTYTLEVFNSNSARASERSMVCMEVKK